MLPLNSSFKESFESLTSVSLDKCDEFAKLVAGDSLRRSDVQGCSSYTVFAGKDEKQQMFEFRASNSLIDRKMLEEIAKLHPGFVPEFKHHAFLDKNHSLVVTIMEGISGVAYAAVECPDDQLRRKTIEGYARFFAQSWNAEPIATSQDQRNEMLKQIQDKLDAISAGLPVLAPLITFLKEKLPALFLSEHRCVLTHGDLCNLNVFIDPQTFRITGIIDWSKVTVSPFGLAMYAVFNCLGWMDQEGWHYHKNYDWLIKKFWKDLGKFVSTPLSDQNKWTIRTACTIGIILRYGYASDGEGGRRVTRTTDTSFQYLRSWFNTNREINSLVV